MKVVVIGGSGLIGTRLVKRLRERGRDVVAASPDSGVNTFTGAGLVQTLVGAQVVVDVSNAPSSGDTAVMDFFETSGRNILAAERDTGVRHHVALSVVGTDRLQASGYFRAKMAQERLTTESGVPHTIVRSTQFFEFAKGIAQSATDGLAVRLPAALVQPIAADDVAAMLADVAEGPPVNGTIELAGPESMPLGGFVQRYLRAVGDPRTVTVDIHVRYFGAELTDDTLRPGANPRIGRTRFEDWLRDAAPRSPA